MPTRTAQEGSAHAAISAMLVYWCMHVRGMHKCGEATLAACWSEIRRRHCHCGQTQHGRSESMHTEQQSSQRGARACQSGERSYLLFGVQRGGAIAILGQNSMADLRSCTLSSNQAEEVCGYANQEHCRRPHCMLHSVLCFCACPLLHACKRSAETVLAVCRSERGCHCHLGKKQQGRSEIMHTEQQSSQRGARACQSGAVWEGSANAAMTLRSSALLSVQ